MNNLKRKRKELGLSQSQLSKKADISLRTLQEYEQQRRDINGASGITLYKIAKALNCNIEDLLEISVEDYKNMNDEKIVIFIDEDTLTEEEKQEMLKKDKE